MLSRLMQPRSLPALVAAAALIVTAFAGVERVNAEPAVNQFEIKDLEAEPGNLQFQSQNAISTRQPRRKFIETEPGEHAFDDNSVVRERVAQELEAHLSSFFRMRIGIEFERQRLDEPGLLEHAEAYDNLKLSELAIEGVLVLVPPKDRALGVGLIAEYQHSMIPTDPHTLFMGTILQANAGPWSATANLFMVKHFAPLEISESGHASRDSKWDFAYASQVKYRHSDTWAFAIEAYGTVDRVANAGMQEEEAHLFGRFDQHRVGPIVYYSFKMGGGRLKDRLGRASPTGLDADDAAAGMRKVVKGDGDDDEPMAILGFGVLAGITPHTPGLTYKLSLEVEF